VADMLHRLFLKFDLLGGEHHVFKVETVVSKKNVTVVRAVCYFLSNESLLFLFPFSLTMPFCRAMPGWG
jgi:hypothetical protein